MDTSTLSDILPALDLSGRGGVLPLQLLCLALAASIFAVLGVGARLYRRWSATRLEAFADVEWASSSVVEEGMPATLETPSPTGIRAAQSMVRAVEKKWIALSAPEGADSTIGIGSPIAVRVQGGAALYRFHAEVMDRRTSAGVPTLYIGKPARVEKVQRREHFRVTVHLPTALTVLGDGEQPAIRGDIDSLSGGGFRIAVPSAIAPGSLVRVRLPVVTLLGYSFEARVIRCAEARDFGPMRFRASCEFIHLPEETRNLIVGYCFDVQREMRGGGPARM